MTFMHVPSLKPLFTIQEQTNSLNTLDFSWSGKIFATGGKDFHVRLYDEGTFSLTETPKPSFMTSNLPDGIMSDTTTEFLRSNLSMRTP